MQPMAETVFITLIQLAGVILLLLVADRWLHKHLQGVMFLITGDSELALAFYAILLFPGVALHELSHALVAVLLGVDIGKISLLPKSDGKTIRFGYVSVAGTGVVRDSLIGIAPLVIGGFTVAVIGHQVFGTPAMLEVLAAGEILSALAIFRNAFKATNGWIWGYLLFCISNTMLPSRSDTRAWPQVVLMVSAIAILIALLGGSGLVINGLGSLLSVALNWIILLGISTLIIDIPVFILLLLLEKLLERLKHVRLEYRL